MKVYLVGGAVRDRLLGLGKADRDWVVVGASVKQMLAAGYVQVGRDFPVFLHPQSKEEYALARTERKSGRGHTGFTVNADPSVTLEEDLMRRDLSINAMAEDADGNLIDPWGGARDIEARVLRHVSPAFGEDPLRILRVARFAARFASHGFTVAPETLQLMQDMVSGGELQHLPPERIWREMEIALREGAPDVFIRVLRECNALGQLLPEIDSLFGLPHPEAQENLTDSGERSLAVLRQARRLSDDPVVLYAALLHDVGRGAASAELPPGRLARLGVKLVEEIGSRLRVSRDHNNVAKLVCRYHRNCHRLLEARPLAVLRLLEALDAFRRPRQMEQFLMACEATALRNSENGDSGYPQATLLRNTHAAASDIDIPALLTAHGLLPPTTGQRGQAPDAQRPEERIRELIRRERCARIRQAIEASS